MTLPFPAWLDAHRQTQSLSPIRAQAWQNFLKAGWPTKKDERWKYADFSVLHRTTFALSQSSSAQLTLTKEAACIDRYRLPNSDHILLVLLDGHFVPSLSDVDKIPKTVIMCPLQTAYEQYPDLVNACCEQQTPHVFAHLNEAMWQDGLFIFIPPHHELTHPIHLLSIATQDKPLIAHTRHMVSVGEKARLILLEEHVGMKRNEVPYAMNLSTIVSVQKGGVFNHYKIQQEDKQSVHLTHTTINQAQDSEVTSTCFSQGGLFARDDLIIKLTEKGARCQLACFYHAERDRQYLDHFVEVEHRSAHTHSDMLYKGILNNNAKGVFNGRLLVSKQAQKVIAQQANHNLLLSTSAEVYSKPTLEIYADDVQCRHGATIGQLDKEALFYFCSRGIPETIAINLLLKGFMQEIIERIPLASIKQHVETQIMEKFS